MGIRREESETFEGVVGTNEMGREKMKNENE